MGVGLVGGQGGCERRIEVFVKIKKNWGCRGVWVGARVWEGGQGGCERKIEVFGKIHKKNQGGGDVGYGGCEPRIEGIVQCTTRYCTILRKLKKMWGWGGAIFKPKTLSMFLKKK